MNIIFRKVVAKNNSNKGRQFYSCPNRTCNFFEWNDNRGNGNNLDNSSVKVVKKRKCGFCGEEGHTKRNCPQKTD